MAHHILAARPLLDNDKKTIAHLLKIGFRYFLLNNSPFYKDYIKSLRTVVGLGFTAALVDRDLLVIYEIYLNKFLTYKEGDIRKSPQSITLVAQALAEMIETAAMSFSALGCPPYYVNFLKALDYILTCRKTIFSLEEQKSVLIILAKLGKDKFL